MVGTLVIQQFKLVTHVHAMGDPVKNHVYYGVPVQGAKFGRVFARYALEGFPWWDLDEGVLAMRGPRGPPRGITGSGCLRGGENSVEWMIVGYLLIGVVLHG